MLGQDGHELTDMSGGTSQIPANEGDGKKEATGVCQTLAGGVYLQHCYHMSVSS